MRINKSIAILGVCACLGIGGVGAYALYISQVDAVENQFTVVAGGNDDAGDIVEEKWDPEKAKELYPMMIVDKDPKFVSTAEYEGWAIMKVVIPNLSVIVNTQTMEEQIMPSFALVEQDTTNWTYLYHTSDDTATTYYFGYLTPVAPGGQTTPVFNGIQVVDLIMMENEFAGTVDVSATLVQREGHNSVVAAWNTLDIGPDITIPTESEPASSEASTEN